MIKTIIFDLAGVYFTKGAELAIEKVSSKYGIPKEKVWAVLHNDSELGTLIRLGKISSDEFLRRGSKILGKQLPIDDITRISVDGYKPIEGTVALVDRLRKAGYKLIFISNNTAERAQALESRFHFRKRFDDGVLSFEAHVMKPDPKIFRIAVEKSKHQANECVYVDDDPRFVVPARDFGMKTIIFENPAQLGADLRKLGLEF